MARYFDPDRAFLPTGIEIIISAALPTYPSDRENMRRWVRHAFHPKHWADSLGDVGMQPGEPTHCVTHTDLAGPGTAVLFVSREYYARLREQMIKEQPLQYGGTW